MKRVVSARSQITVFGGLKRRLLATDDVKRVKGEGTNLIASLDDTEGPLDYVSTARMS